MPTTSDDVTQAVLDNSVGPRKVDGDEATVEQHSIPDQIAAAKFAASQTGVANPSRGIRFSQIVPPGAGGA